MAAKSPDKVSSLEAHNHTLKTNLEEMRAHVGQLKHELDQEQSTVKQLRREKVLEIKQLKQENEKHCNAIISDLKSKLLAEKKRELFDLKEQLTKQHNTEINRISHTKDEALKRSKLVAQKEKEDFFLRKKHELLLEGKENATKVFEGEKTKLLQEVDELKRSKKQLEEELRLAVNADKQKATDLRRSHEERLRELDQIRKEAKTDIRRLIEELKSKDRVIGDLEKELGHQSSYSQRLLLEKDSLGSLLNLTKMAESWEKRSPRALSSMKKSYSLDLSNLADNEDSDKERRLQVRLSDLSNTVRRLEDRNRQLMDEKTDIEKKMAGSPTSLSSSSQAEKSRWLSKKMKDIEQSNKRLEEKNRILEMENKRLRTLKDQMRSRLERENKNLKKALNEEHANSIKEEESEVELLRAKLERQAKVIDELKHVATDTSRDVLRVDKNESMRSLNDEVSLASECGTSIISDDEDGWNEFDKAELEANYQQLSKEYLQLKKAYTQLQTMVGGTLDPQREAKMRRDLESDLIESQAMIEALQKSLQDNGSSVDWLSEKRAMQQQIEKTNEKVNELEYSLKQAEDEKDLLEFQLLETSEEDDIIETGSPRASTPRIMITHHISTDGAGLQHACTLDGFDEILFSELKRRLEALNKGCFLSTPDSELLGQTLKMLTVADKRLVAMEEEITSLRRNVSEVENERDILATDKVNMSAELANQTLEGQSAQEKVTELQQTVEQLKHVEEKMELVEGAFKRSEERLQQENEKLKKRLSDANEGRNNENEMLQQKINENKQLEQRVTELERELNLRERHLNKTERQRLLAMEKEVTQHKKTIKNLQDFLMEHETKGAEMQEEKTLLEEENKELVQETSHLKMKVAELGAQKAKFQEQLENCEENKNSLEKTIHVKELEHSNRITELQHKMAEMDRKLQTVIEENERLLCQIRSFEDNDVTVDKYKQLLNEVKEIRTIKNDQRIQIQTLEEKLNQYEGKVVESSDEDTSCSLSLPIDNTHINHEKGDNEKTEKELKEKLDELETSEVELKEEIKNLKSSDETLKKTLSQLITENSMLVQEKSKVESEVEELKEEESMLKKVIKDQMMENGKLRNNQEIEIVSSRDIEKDALRKELGDIQASECMLKEQVCDLMQKNNELAAQRSEMSKQLQQFISVESQLHREITELQSTVKELQESKHSVNNQVDEDENIVNTIQILEDNKQQLENKVKLLQDDKDALELKMQEIEQLVRDAGIADTYDLQKSIEFLKNKIDELQGEQQQLKTEAEESKENENKLQTKLDEMQESEEALFEKISKLNENNERLIEELNETKEQIASLEEIRQNLKEKVEETEEQLEELKITSISMGDDNLGGTSKSLQDDLGSSFDYGAKDNIIDELKEEIGELQTQVTELKEENERLQNELSSKHIVEEEIEGEKTLIDFSTPPPLPESPPPLPVSLPTLLLDSQPLLPEVTLPVNSQQRDEAAIWEELERMKINSNQKVDFTMDINQFHVLSENVRMKEKQNEDLVEKVKMLEDKNYKCNQDLHNMQKELDDMGEILLEKNKDIEELEKAIAQSRRRHSEHDLHKHDLEEEVEELKISILEMEESEEVLESKVKELEQQCSDLEEHNLRLKDKVSALECVESDAKDMKIALKDMEEQNSLLVQHVSDFKNMEEKLNEKIKEAETSANMVDALSHESKELKQKIESIETSNLSKSQKLDDVTKMNVEIVQKLQISEEKAIEEMQILKSRIKELEVKEKDLLEKVSLLEDNENQMDSEQDVVQSLTLELQRVQDDLGNKISKLQENIEEKDRVLEESANYCQELENKVAEFEKHENEYMEKREQCAQLKSECDNLKVRVQDLEKSEHELLEIATLIEKIQGDDEKMKVKIQSLENEIHEKENCLQLIKEENAELLLQCSSIPELKEKINQLGKQLDVSESDDQIQRSNSVSESMEIVVETIEQPSVQKTTETAFEDDKNICSMEKMIKELKDEKQEMQQRIFELEQKENAFQETLSHADAIMLERESDLLEQINELETSQGDLKKRLEAVNNTSEDRASDDWHDALDDTNVDEELIKPSKDEEIRHLQQRILELEETELQQKLELQNMNQNMQDALLNSNQRDEKFESSLKRLSELEETEAKLLEELEKAENMHTTLTEANEELLEEVAILRLRVEDLESTSHAQPGQTPSDETLSQDTEKLQEELENVIMQLQDLQENEEKLREEVQDKESLVKELKKLNVQLQDDVEIYCNRVKELEESEKKLKEILNQQDKSGDALKVNLTELEERISELEATKSFLTERLSEKHESEDNLKRELLSSENNFNESEKSLKESQELLKKQLYDMEEVDNELRIHVKVMEDSEADLKEKVLKLELVAVNAVQQIEKLESSNETLRAKALSSEEAEKLMRIDFNQMKHEKDIFNDKICSAEKVEKMLRGRIEDLESVESQIRTQVWKLERGELKMKDKIQELEENNSSMERKSNQAIELEQEVLRLQNELQETNIRQDQLQRSNDQLQDQLNKLHINLNNGTMETAQKKVSLPEEEYHQMKAQVTLLSVDMPEQPQIVGKLPDLLHQLSHLYTCKFINDFVLQNTPTTGHKSLKDALESVSQDCFPAHLTEASIGNFYILYRLQALEDMFEDLEEPLNATRLHNTPGHSHIIFDENDQPVEIHCALCARKKMQEKKRAAEQWLATVALETHPTNLIQREVVSKESYTSFEESTPLQQASPNTRRKLIDDLVNALPMITVEESVTDQSNDDESVVVEEVLNETKVDDKLEAPPLPVEPPPLPSSAPPTHKRGSVSSEMSDNPPPLPEWPPPVSSKAFVGTESAPLRKMNGHDESDGIQRPRSLFAKPLSFDSGTETLSTTTVDQETEQPLVGRTLSLPVTPKGKRETPELPPKPPTPLWLKKMMEWQSQEKDKEINEAQRMKTQNTILQSKIDEKDNLIQEIRKREEDMKRKLRDMEHISISRQKIQAKELELEEKNFEIASLKSENWQKEREISTLQSRINELQRSQQNYVNEDGILKKMRDELDLTKERLRMKENQLKNIDYDEKNLKEQSQLSTLKLQEKDEELSKKAEELRKLREKLNKLEKEVADTQSNNTKATHMQQHLESLQREKIQLQEQVAMLPEMEENIEALKEQQRKMDLALREKDAVDRKLQLAENMLREKTGQEMFLVDENASLQEKVNHLEKLHKYKDNIEKHYQDIREKFDTMEQQKNEAELAICPLKAKVSYLREKCKERDLLIKKMSRLLQAHVDSSLSGQLLSEVSEIQTSLPSEEYNQPLPHSSQLKKSSKKDYLPKGNSAATFNPLSPLSRKSLSSEGLEKKSGVKWSRSHDLGGQLSQSLHNGLDELDLTEGISVTDLLQKTAKPQTRFATRNDSVEDLLDSLQTLSETIRGRSANHSRDAETETLQERSRDWLSTSSPSGADILSRTRSRRLMQPSVHLNSSPERIVQMHQELQESHVSHYDVPYQSSVDPVLSSGITSNSPVANGTPQNKGNSRSNNHLSTVPPGQNMEMNEHSNGLINSNSYLNNTTNPSLSQHTPSSFNGLPGNNRANRPVTTQNAVPSSNGVGPPRQDMAHLGQLNTKDLSNGLTRVLPEPSSRPVLAAQPRNLHLNHTNVTRNPTMHSGVDIPDMSGGRGKAATTGHSRSENKHVQAEPPEPPTQFSVAKQFGKHGILLTWIPPVMDRTCHSNSSRVVGYKLYVNGQQRQFVSDANLKKALVDGVDLNKPVTFGIQTMSDTGLHSRIVHTNYNILAVPYSTHSDSAVTDSFHELTTTEGSSVFSDDQEERLFIAVYEYIPEKHSPNDFPAYELAFEEGDILTIYGQKRQDGFYQGKVRGKHGLVPSNFIEEIAMSGRNHSKRKRSNNHNNRSSEQTRHSESRRSHKTLPIPRKQDSSVTKQRNRQQEKSISGYKQW